MKEILTITIEEDGIHLIMMFSVIIRTKNEARWIGHCIQSILDNIPSNEIIIVDNNSNDRTLEIINMFKKNPNLEDNPSKYTDITNLTIDEYTPGKALNLGIANAKYDNILIISSHCVLTKFNLEKCQKNLESYAAFFGNQIPVYEGQKITKRYLWEHFSENEVVNMYSDLEKRQFFHNALSFFNKSCLQEIKFDEGLQGKEDRYWAEKLVKSGKKYLYDPSFECNHYYTSNGNTWKGIG